MKTLRDRIADASKYVSRPDSVEFVTDCLNRLGITVDDIGDELLLSEDCKEGDARNIFVDKEGMPIVRFRRMWRILKNQEESSKETAKKDESSGGLTKELIEKITPIGQWTDRDLLEKYGPECPQNIETELKVRSDLRNCVIFKNKSEIDVELSLKLLREARRRDVPSVYKDGGKTYRVYRIGEFPEDVYTRCPVTGKILFDNYSEDLGIKWEMEMDGLQFVALMVKAGIDVGAIVARDLQKEYKEKGLEGLKNLFPNIGVLYDDLKEVNDLPNLLATMTSRDVVQDPFSRRHKRF